MFSLFDISASGMEAQRLRMSVIASNLANVNTTRTATGGPYRRRDVVFAPVPQRSFGDILRASYGGGDGTAAVRVQSIILDQRPFKYVHDPSHPDADADGYVAMPNINTVEEMVNMIAASRSYDANVTAFKASRDMVLKALEIGS
ncbi:MAG TPA: flagellar basal body rod protein FlgC [Deltaproteobacteria bacterium]|nr:flagellar basal body rod protein FlgC [Deltaproteobacteria bacterium]